jgi:hypothetical protein
MVYVEWLDHTTSIEWLTPRQVQKLFPTKIKSVGYLVANQKSFIVLALCVASSGDMQNFVTIMKDCMLRFDTLALEVEKKNEKRNDEKRKTLVTEKH